MDTPKRVISGGAVIGAHHGDNLEILATVGKTTIAKLTEAAASYLSTATHTHRTCQSVKAGNEGAVKGVGRGVTGGMALIKTGEMAVETGVKVLSTAGKVVGTVGGALGVIAGGVEMGFAITRLVTGTTTQNSVIEFKDALKAVNTRSLNASQCDVFNRALRETETLLKDVTLHVRAVNGTKVGSGAVSAIGGGLSVAGIFFPPLLIAGLITVGVGAVTGITTTIIELTADHKNRLINIMEKLMPSGLYALTSE